MIDRREVLGGAAALVLLQGCGVHMDEIENPADLFGLIGQMKAQPGKRAELLRILSEGTQAMPGNLTYLISEDRADPDALWIVEVWQDEASHKASLSLPPVREAIGRGRPLIAGFGTSAQVRPVAGTH